MAQVTFVDAQEVLYAYLAGEIDHHTAQTLRRKIDAELAARAPEGLVLDFSAVGFMDSSGIGLILGRMRQMQAYDGKLMVQNPPGTIQKMLELAKIEYI